MIHKTGGGNTPQVKNDLKQVVAIICLFHCVADVEWENIEKCVKIVSYF